MYSYRPVLEWCWSEELGRYQSYRLECVDETGKCRGWVTDPVCNAEDAKALAARWTTGALSPIHLEDAAQDWLAER